MRQEYSWWDATFTILICAGLCLLTVLYWSSLIERRALNAEISASFRQISAERNDRIRFREVAAELQEKVEELEAQLFACRSEQLPRVEVEVQHPADPPAPATPPAELPKAEEDKPTPILPRAKAPVAALVKCQCGCGRVDCRCRCCKSK